MVYEIEKEASDEFENLTIDLRKLFKFETNRNSAKPFSVTLKDILKAKITEL